MSSCRTSAGAAAARTRAAAARSCPDREWAARSSRTARTGRSTSKSKSTGRESHHRWASACCRMERETHGGGEPVVGDVGVDALTDGVGWRMRRVRLLVLLPGVAAVPGEPVAAVGVVDHEGVDDLRRGGDHDHVRGLVRRPGVAGAAERGLLGDGRGERVAAGAADPGHSVAVDEDGGAGLQDGLVAGGGAVAVAVVGDAGVHAQLQGRERAEVGRDLGRVDARRRRRTPGSSPGPPSGR